MSENAVIITLIGKNLAKMGLEFIYKGELEKCEGCRMFKVCNNLLPKRRYRIVGLRGNTVHSCNIHNSGVCAIEVIEPPVIALIESKRAIPKSEIIFNQTCPNLTCSLYDICFPEGVIEGERYQVSGVFEENDQPCAMSRKLRKVELTPI
jgi:uncharacterized protein (UPF0179 family)